jgi:hypothetical protein
VARKKRVPAFSVKDCALVALATGRKAVTLAEFRDHLLEVEAGSLYHHFWGGLLTPRFEEREYGNDFASWLRHGLHDAVLAERFAVIDPMNFPDLSLMRQELVELIEFRLDEAEHLHWTRATAQFEFIRSQIVVFDTDARVSRPESLPRAIPSMSSGSIFYHFIDARRRTPGSTDDFSTWLETLDGDYTTARTALAGVDPYFGSLTELRDELAGIFKRHFGAQKQ